MDPFATLGVERRFDLDLRALERTHRELSKVTHPDRQSSAPPSSRVDALGRSVAINEALRIVRDPVRRAEALLSLCGVAVGEGSEPAPTHEFLTEMLEQREALEAAKDAADLTGVQALGEAIDARRLAAEAELARGFDAAGGDRAALERLVPHLGELRFYRRFLEQVSAIEDELTGLS